MPTRAILIGLVAALVAGCDLQDNTFNVQGKVDSPGPPTPPYTYRYPPEPPIVTAADLKEFVSRYTRMHRVVLIDVWAGWSSQCREQMTDLSLLQTDLPTERFQVVSVNMDSPNLWRDKTVPILQAGRANFPCLVVPAEQRSEMRTWLSANWNYEVPARFVIDRDGAVAAQLLRDTPIAFVRQEARRFAMQTGNHDQVASRRGVRPPIEASSASETLRTRIVDLRTGEWRSPPELKAGTDDTSRLANMAVEAIAASIDLSTNPRIAIIASPARGSAGTSEDSRVMAENIVSGLRAKGYDDVIGPAKTQRMLRDSGVDSVSLAEDPSLLRGRLSVDYLVIGDLSGRSQSATAHPVVAAGANGD